VIRVRYQVRAGLPVSAKASCRHVAEVSAPTSCWPTKHTYQGGRVSWADAV